jgi:hypothetical protein
MTGWVALPLAISRPALLAIWSRGMAEPTPILPDCPSVLTELATRAIAKFTPTTRPAMSSNGSAAAARVVCRVALDRVDERGARGAGPAGGYRAVQGADNATGHGGVQTQGSTHPDDRLTHAHILGGAQHQHRQVCGARRRATRGPARLSGPGCSEGRWSPTGVAAPRFSGAALGHSPAAHAGREPARRGRQKRPVPSW